MNAEIARDYRTMILARLPVVSFCIVAAFALGMLLGGVLF
jgi:hypothetical protein